MPAPGLYKCPRCSGQLSLADGHWAVNTYRCGSCNKEIREVATGRVFHNGHNDLTGAERDAPVPSKEVRNQRWESGDDSGREQTLGWLKDLGIGPVHLGKPSIMRWDPSPFEDECHVVYRMLKILAGEVRVDLPEPEGEFKSAIDGIPSALSMTAQLKALRTYAPNLIDRIAILGGIELGGA